MLSKRRFIYFIVDNNVTFLKYRALYFKKFLNKEQYIPKVIYFDKHKKSLLTLVKEIKKHSIIYVIDIGNSKFIFAIICKIFLHTKTVFDIGDDYYLLNKEKGIRGYKLKKVFLLQYFFLKLSDIIITRGYYHKKYLNRIGYRKVYQIPDCIYLKHSKEYNVQKLKKQYATDRFLTIGLIGTLNWNDKYQICYGWELIEALNILKNLRIKAIIIGYGNGLKYLKEKTKKYGITDKVIFIGKVPYSKVPMYLSLIDIGLSTQTNNSVGWFRTTGKLPEYLALNKYVIATNVGEAKRVLKNIGSLLPYKNVKDTRYPVRLAKEIKKIYYNREILKRGFNGRKMAEKFFNYEKEVKKLEKILNQLR